MIYKLIKWYPSISVKYKHNAGLMFVEYNSDLFKYFSKDGNSFTIQEIENNKEFWQKVKSKPLIGLDYHGNNIFEDDHVYYVSIGNLSKHVTGRLSKGSLINALQSYKFFVNEQDADNYILENNQLLSISDLKNITKLSDEAILRLKDIVKSRL